MSSISDAERREVAARLREIERQTLCELTDGELIDFLVEAVGFNRYTNEDFDEGLLGRIAELIDRPTTELSVDEDGRTCCASCGCACLYMGSATYCPDCGAEVVPDGC